MTANSERWTLNNTARYAMRETRCSDARQRAAGSDGWQPKIGILNSAGCLLLFALTLPGCGSKAAASRENRSYAGAALSGAVTLPPAAVGGGNTEAFARDVATRQGRFAARVDLSATDVTDDDLARWEYPDTVQEIDLSRTRITDRGIEQLIRARNLEVLDLIDTQVTENVVEILKRMPRLCDVRLDNTKVPKKDQIEMVRFLGPRASARVDRIYQSQRTIVLH